MLYAIFESGGKQFKATEGSLIEVDHLPTEEGKKVSFDKVLLLVNDKDVQVGTPVIKGASIDATVVNHFKGKKVIIFNYRPKKHYRVKTGHRQQYTRLLVNSIDFTGKIAKAKEEKKPEAKVETPKAKKASASKPAANKPAAKKAEASKPAAKKPAAKKASTSKPVAKKTTAAKSAASKKTTTTAAKKSKTSTAAKTEKK